MTQQPVYDVDALKKNIEREEANVKLFTEEADKARDRKAELKEMLRVAEAANKSSKA